MYMRYICVVYVLHMCGVCITYVSCMYYICVMYVYALHMCGVCITYVWCMYYICVMYVYAQMMYVCAHKMTYWVGGKNTSIIHDYVIRCLTGCVTGIFQWLPGCVAGIYSCLRNMYWIGFTRYIGDSFVSICIQYICYICSFVYNIFVLCVQPIPLRVTISNAVSKLKAQSSIVSFHWNVAKETFELWAFENVTPSGIGCITISICRAMTYWVCGGNTPRVYTYTTHL